MTKQERLKAFEMRLDGKSWSEIGRAIGYSSTAVQQDLQGCVLTKPRQVHCVYPVIRRIITEDYGGSVRAFAADCGISYGAMYYTLSGKCFVPPERQEVISKAIGIPPVEAFEREEEP